MMEMQAGATGGHLIGRTPRPGQLRLWTAHCIAHGADTVVYFRWRTCLFGTEQYWQGILPHDGRPQRRYYELQETIREMTPILQDIEGIVTKAKVAVMFSYDQSHAFKIQPHHPDLNYVEQVKLYYESFYRHQIAVDFINEQPAVTVNQYGRGRAYYVGTEPDRGILNKLTEPLILACALTAEGTAPAGVELTVRQGHQRNYLFAVNHHETEQLIALNSKWEPLLPVKAAAGDADGGARRYWLTAGYDAAVFTAPQE